MNVLSVMIRWSLFSLILFWYYKTKSLIFTKRAARLLRFHMRF